MFMVMSWEVRHSADVIGSAAVELRPARVL